ncbi:MAG TPA: sulfite exporter TauE/SafE family protein [Bryobacteraceae bacterium]|nr:sulfite exporter TauE/SafE family protein [Bryobacteraceae bacterium]
MSARDWIFVALGIFSAGFIWIWFQGKGRAPGVPTLFELLLGFGTNFFDALGIGSFAPTTAIFKFRRMVPDEEIPGTLNVGHSPPTLMEAFLFIAFVQVDVLTLASMMAASVCGAWFGAGIVARWPRRKVQIGMGLALLTAAFFFLVTNLNISLVPAGTALELHGWKLWAGIAGDFVLGALMTLGIGLFAPCMILVSLLGMDPKAAYPIMMGSCAFLMPAASLRFIRRERYSPRPALGLALGGVPAIVIAALIVKALPLYWVRWLVVVAVTYASITMLRSALLERRKPVTGSFEPRPTYKSP